MSVSKNPHPEPKPNYFLTKAQLFEVMALKQCAHNGQCRSNHEKNFMWTSQQPSAYEKRKMQVSAISGPLIIDNGVHELQIGSEIRLHSRREVVN